MRFLDFDGKEVELEWRGHHATILVWAWSSIKCINSSGFPIWDALSLEMKWKQYCYFISQ